MEECLYNPDVGICLIGLYVVMLFDGENIYNNEVVLQMIAKKAYQN